MTLCFDIDNTIMFTSYEDGTYRVIGYNTPLIAKIKEMQKKGHTIILYTGRHWNHLEITLSQLQPTGINYSSLVMGRPVADLYIDDRALKPEEFLRLFKN